MTKEHKDCKNTERPYSATRHTSIERSAPTMLLKDDSLLHVIAHEEAYEGSTRYTEVDVEAVGSPPLLPPPLPPAEGATPALLPTLPQPAQPLVWNYNGSLSNTVSATAYHLFFTPAYDIDQETMDLGMERLTSMKSTTFYTTVSKRYSQDEGVEMMLMTLAF